jgi:hypothetical protein
MIRLQGLLAAAAIGLGLASASGVSMAQERGAPPPTGDYWNTCRNVSTIGYGPNAVVTAQCQDRYGRWNNTSLRVGNCNEITNVDGRLECRSGGGWNGGNAGGGRPPYGQPQATLYSGLNFSGQAFDTTREYSNLPAYFNDKALSLRLGGRTPWEVCSDANFRGNCQVIDRDVSDLRRYGLGFAVSSLRPIDGPGGGYPPYPPAPPPWGGGGGYRPSTLMMYPSVNFQGAAFETRSEYSNLPRQFNDKAHSLRIVGGGAWEVCVDANHRGRCQVFDRDAPDLHRFGLAEAISSVRQVR